MSADTITGRGGVDDRRTNVIPAATTARNPSKRYNDTPDSVVAGVGDPGAKLLAMILPAGTGRGSRASKIACLQLIPEPLVSHPF